MLKYFLVSITVLIFSSCVFSNEINSKDIEVSFKLIDTTGVEKYNYNRNEEFIVEFKITNNSGEELSYTTGLPAVSYTILKGDSVISHSTDLMTYIAIIFSGKVKDGATFKDSWLAPNTEGRKQASDTIALDVGFYQIEVYHNSFFIEYKLPKTEHILFEVVD